MKGLPTLLVVLLGSLSCGGDGTPTAPTTPTVPTPPPRPQPVIVSFTLDAPECAFIFSRSLGNLSMGQSFEIKFKPIQINGQPDPDVPTGGVDWTNDVEFWLDELQLKGNLRDEDAIALFFSFLPDSRWEVGSFTPQDGFQTTGERRLIHVNGPYRTITYVRRDGSSEWLLDGETILRLPDTKASRSVHTRVVGARADFEYQMQPAASSSTQSSQD